MAAAPSRPPLRSWRFAAALLQGLFYLAYPLVIYAAHTRLGTRGVGGILLGLYGLALLLRLRGSATDLWHVVRQHAALAGLIVAAVVLGNRTLLLLLPMLVSLYLFATFAWSLRRGPPMIERFARMVEDDLPDFTLPYCRRVTGIWCLFLAGNAVLVLGLAVAAPVAWWALYTGALFYVLLGLLVPLAVEATAIAVGVLRQRPVHVPRLLEAGVAILVLLGGFLLRYVFVRAGQLSEFS